MLPDSHFGLQGVQGREMKATAGKQKKHTFNFATQMDAKSKILEIHLGPPIWSIFSFFGMRLVQLAPSEKRGKSYM